MVDRERMERLYVAPLEEFTREREALAREAKAAGDDEAVREIRAIRKPSVAAWAVNRLASDRGEDVERLLQLGQKLREAQRLTMEGGGKETLQALSAERRRLVDRLVDASAELLAASGHAASRSTLDRIAGTLMATATDDEAAERVRRGTLQREVAPPSGLDEVAAWLPATAPKGGRGGTGTVRPAERQRLARARERAEHLETEAAEVDREARRLRAEADRAAREADRARGAAEREEQRAAKARERAESARREADDVAAGQGRRA